MLTVRKASSMLKSHGYRHSPNGTAHFYYKGLNTIIVQQGSEFLDYGKETDKNFIVVYFKKLPDNLNKADVDAVMAKQLRFRAPSNDETIKEAAKVVARSQFAQYGLNDVPEEYIDNYAGQMMKDKKQFEQLLGRAYDIELTKAIKNTVKLDHQAISVKDFNAKFNA